MICGKQPMLKWQSQVVRPSWWFSLEDEQKEHENLTTRDVSPKLKDLAHAKKLIKRVTRICVAIIRFSTFCLCDCLLIIDSLLVKINLPSSNALLTGEEICAGNLVMLTAYWGQLAVGYSLKYSCQ